MKKYDAYGCYEVSTAVSGVIAGQKYSLLTNHYRPGGNFMFPKTFSDG